jgi:hypothetical protein
MNYLGKDLILCSQVWHYQHDSLLLHQIGLDMDSLLAKLILSWSPSATSWRTFSLRNGGRHLDCLPPLLSETVHQWMTNKYVLYLHLFDCINWRAPCDEIEELANCSSIESVCCNKHGRYAVSLILQIMIVMIIVTPPSETFRPAILYS